MVAPLRMRLKCDVVALIGFSLIDRIDGVECLPSVKGSFAFNSPWFLPTEFLTFGGCQE